MSESISSREIIDRLVKQSGIKKKLAAQILHIIPGIVEEGLLRDGEVRVKGLGTFRLKWTMERVGRNPKTGERVQIPPHNRLVFLPEHSFKEYINRDFRLLSYKIIPSVEKAATEGPIILEPQPEQYPVIEHLPQPQPVYEPEPWPAPGPETLYEPEAPIIKRRVHWIVPVAISVIIVLSLIFYFRNFYHADSQQPAVSSQQSAVGGQQPAVSSQQPAVDGQQPAVGDQQSAINDEQPAIDNQQSTSSQKVTSAEGKHLFKLAREVYGNPYLWVLIYMENQDKIPDPDMLLSGTELKIPALEGTPGHLTKNDSLQISEGYRLVYEFYKAKGDPRAEDFQEGSARYRPH